MNRRDKLFSQINSKGFGLEIGPSYNPVAPKREGYNVEIVDHLDQPALIDKYKNMGVDAGSIEFVDHVWGGQPLDELIGETARYDWIIASHVIEHVPDVISFLQQCQRLLKPNGALSLAVPDKRFCFDHFRPLNTTGDLLDAYFQKRTRHPPGQVFDHFVSEVNLNGYGTWVKGAGGVVNLGRSTADAKALMDYSLHPESAYVDIHAWRFTPASFQLIIQDLGDLGLLDLGSKANFATVDCEFFVSLGVSHTQEHRERLVLWREIQRELSEGALDGFFS